MTEYVKVTDNVDGGVYLKEVPETPKVVLCMIGQDVAEWLPLSLGSVLPWVKSVVFVDGGSKDNTKKEVMKLCLRSGIKNVNVLGKEYRKDDPIANSAARNMYLDYVKEHHLGDWVLVLDPDEAVHDWHDIPKWIEGIKRVKSSVANLPMRHVIHHLGLEDSTKEKHYVPGRLFNVIDELYYPPGEHPVLTTKKGVRKWIGFSEVRFGMVWHFGMCKGIMHTRKKHFSDVRRSNIHSKKFLKWWYEMSVAGQYPTKQVGLDEYPDHILKFFDISSEELYFANRRGLEAKHWMECYAWKQYFKPNKVLFCGCGMGQRVLAMNMLGVDAWGFDISKYAIENNHCKDKVFVRDIASIFPPGKAMGLVEEKEGEGTISYDILKHDLVICYDVLEHLDEKQLGMALQNAALSSSKYVLISVPFVGDPNLENDPTHKIKKSREWWEKKVGKYFDVIQTPASFPFAHQLIVGVKK